MRRVSSGVRSFLDRMYPETYFRIHCKDLLLTITWNGGVCEKDVRESLRFPLLCLEWTGETRFKRHEYEERKLDPWEAEVYTHNLAVGVGVALKKRIEDVAKKEGTTKSNLVRKVMWEYTEGKA